MTNKYLDGNIGGLEARIVYDVVTPTNPPQKYFYHYDGSGNVSAVTDDSQTTVAQYEYDAYGNIINSSGAYSSQNPWRFSTKYYDDSSGMYYYGFRFYSPGLGKWINRDPIAESGGLNLYGFVGNVPNNGADAYGFSQDMRGGDGTVRFSFAAFIPDKSIPFLGNDYGGDNRGYRSNSPSYRIQENFRVNLRNGTVRFDDPTAGLTTVDGVTQKRLSKIYGVSHSFSRTASGGYKIHIQAAGKDPAWYFPYTDHAAEPAIAYSLDITLRSDGSVCDVSGNFKQYPAYEFWMYRNGQAPHMVFGYDPRKHNKTVKNLFSSQYLSN